jgi:hypothetical protein
MECGVAAADRERRNSGAGGIASTAGETRSSRHPEDVASNTWIGRASKNSCARMKGLDTLGTGVRVGYQVIGMELNSGLLFEVKPPSGRGVVASEPQRSCACTARREAEASTRKMLEIAEASDRKLLSVYYFHQHHHHLLLLRIENIQPVEYHP